MGVDADYMYGYMAEVSDIVWDFDFLKSKYDVNEVLTGYYSDYTYGDIIEWMENDKVDDWYEVGEELGIRIEYAYGDCYLIFTHEDVAEEFPDGKLKDLDDLAKEYAKQLGVKNGEIFKWDEFGYFN